jgi:ATP-dependent HslUV protease subunit HslV
VEVGNSNQPSHKILAEQTPHDFQSNEKPLSSRNAFHHDSGRQTSGPRCLLKADTRKVRWILDKKMVVGFAGSTADAFALLERFETKAKNFPGNLPRAATELARDWRTDRILRKLEAMMIVVDPEHSLLITGQGDVVQPADGILGIGSGGNFAIAAARALIKHSSLSAGDIVRESLRIASEIDVYTNDNIVVEEFPTAN